MKLLLQIENYCSFVGYRNYCKISSNDYTSRIGKKKIYRPKPAIMFVGLCRCVQARIGGIGLQTSIYSNLLMDFDLVNVTANQMIAFIMRCYMYIDIYIGYYVIRHFSLIFSLSQAVISSYATERVTSSNYI